MRYILRSVSGGPGSRSGGQARVGIKRDLTRVAVALGIVATAVAIVEPSQRGAAEIVAASLPARAQATESPSEMAGLVSLVPARLLDSRSANSTVDGISAGMGVRPADSITPVTVAGRGGVPHNAVAVMLNVTVVDAMDDGFAVVYPCGQAVPTASNLNFRRGDTVPNAVVAKIGVDATVCVYTWSPVHLIVDVNAYVPGNHGVVALTPARLLDTRSTNSTVDGLFAGSGVRPADSITEVAVIGRGGVPADTAAVMVNVTAVDALADGFATVSHAASRCPQPPI